MANDLLFSNESCSYKFDATVEHDYVIKEINYEGSNEDDASYDEEKDSVWLSGLIIDNHHKINSKKHSLLSSWLNQIDYPSISYDNSRCSDDVDGNQDNESEEDLELAVKDWPWIDQSLSKSSSDCVRMTDYDEDQYMKSLSKTIKYNENNMKPVPADIYMTYRKLFVRKLKRERNLKTFNFDDYLEECLHGKPSHCLNYSSGLHFTLVGDNVQLPLVNILSTGPYPDFSCVISFYTNRSLKPFIWCDAETKPPWLKILYQIKQRKYHSDVEDITQVIEHSPPICYSYIRSEHISAINSLCSVYFWPGIDLSESLQYPDFSCVALYKKLIVGFALMVPDVTATDCYISFLFSRPGWRNCGIATFMLYHLIQTCMGKDITLHVAADNPSLFLYQKFGFKVEQFVQNFYEKYLPISSKQCKHALFLRLNR